MLENLQPIQVFNAVVNTLSMAVVVPFLISIWQYKRRAKERFDQIERDLDRILLLAHELYQTDIKDRKKLLAREAEATKIISGETDPKTDS